MKRFLFVVPPLAGHVNPTVSVARELQGRGHRVAWAAHAGVAERLLPAGAEVLPLGDPSLADRTTRPVRGLESLQLLWQEVLVPLARATLPGALHAIRRYEPDLVIVDHQALGGALAARACGVRWASFCTTSASVVDPLAALPRVKAWVEEQLAELQSEAGLPVLPGADLSSLGVIVFSTAELIGASTFFPAHYHFVGPSISDRPDRASFSWDRLRPGPKVFVSLGTVSAQHGESFHRTVVESLSDRPYQCILVAPPGHVPSPPENFLVGAPVPQLALLPHVRSVLCHAGHNTVCEALAHGLPLVVAPIRDDQPVIADQVVRAGAGVRVRFGRVDAGTLRAAVERTLEDPGLREAAVRLQASFRAAGGAGRAARLLEAMT
jgi:MGT family glycosyltransferase